MYFSKQLYIQAIKKLKSVGIGMSVTVLLLNLLYVLTSRDLLTFVHHNKTYLITTGEVAPFTFLVIIFTFFLSTSAFSFLNTRRGSDFYHSIPLKRICVYLSFSAAIATWIAGVVLATLVIDSIIFALSPVYTIDVVDVFLLFIGYSISALALSGIVITCRAVSGTSASCVFYTACLLISPRILLTLFQNTIEGFNPCVSFSDTFFQFLNLNSSLYFPFAIAFSGSMRSFPSLLTLLFLFLEAAIFFSLGAYFYVKRKSELAGNTESKGALHRFFRVLVTLPIITATIYASLSDETFSITLIMIALLVHFLFELTLTKNAKKAAKSLPMFFLSFAISFVIIVGGFSFAKVYEITNPTADEIESVTIIDGYHQDYKNLDRFSSTPLYSQQSKEIAAEHLYYANRSVSFNHFSEYYPHTDVKVKFTMKNGSEKYRIIHFARHSTEDTDFEEFMSEIPDFIPIEKYN